MFCSNTFYVYIIIRSYSKIKFKEKFWGGKYLKKDKFYQIKLWGILLTFDLFLMTNDK